MRFALVRIRGKRSGGFLGVGRFSRGDQFCVCARDRREESERQRRVVKSQFLRYIARSSLRWSSHRETAHLAFAFARGDDASRIIKKVISPINRRALFWGVDHTTTMNTNSFARSEVFFVLFTLQILERASARLLHGSTFVVFVFSFRSLFEAFGCSCGASSSSTSGFM